MVGSGGLQKHYVWSLNCGDSASKCPTAKQICAITPELKYCLLNTFSNQLCQSKFLFKKISGVHELQAQIDSGMEYRQHFPRFRGRFPLGLTNDPQRLQLQ